MNMLKDRAQSHVNLVFNFIAQQENRINRIVAENGAQIAAASKRDGAAMKAIAVVATIFLPLTFVSVWIFSVS